MTVAYMVSIAVADHDYRSLPVAWAKNAARILKVNPRQQTKNTLNLPKITNHMILHKSQSSPVSSRHV